MENYCKLCGQNLSEDTKTCPNGHSLDFKKMCINCKHFNNNDSYCTNNEVMELMRNNILTEIKEKNISLGNFNIKNIELTPATIKVPTKRCSKWELNEEIVNLLISKFK